MDYSPIINEVLKLWWMIPILLVIAVVKSPWFKGVLGEASVQFSARLRLPSETYHPIHNVTLPTLDGTTQIDHIFVSRFGIFVVETKNMKRYCDCFRSRCATLAKVGVSRISCWHGGMPAAAVDTTSPQRGDWTTTLFKT